MKLLTKVKTVLAGIKETCDRKLFRGMLALSGAATVALQSCPVAAALGTGIDASVATSGVSNLASIIRIAGSVVGGVLVVWGGIQFALSMRNEDAEGKTKATYTLIAGAIAIIVAQVGGGLLTGDNLKLTDGK